LTTAPSVARQGERRFETVGYRFFACLPWPRGGQGRQHEFSGRTVAGCSYFEHPVPVEHFEYACANPIRIEADGCVSAPDGPGLGLDIDWKQIERDASLLIDTETM
jgi:hypothetical protein